MYLSFSMGRLYAVAFTSVVSIGMVGSDVFAAPQIELIITGNYSAGEDGPDTRLEDTSFINTYDGGGASNGSQNIEPEGSFSYSRIEVFSDPDLFVNPSLYNEVSTFGYFGLLKKYNEQDNFVSQHFFIAVDPAQLDYGSVSFGDIFADYLANPTNEPNEDDRVPVGSLSEFVQILDDGPDYPTDGANQAWIHFNGSVTGDERFQGEILTTFQPGETLDLVFFDISAGFEGFGSKFGEIQVEALNIPEPMALGLLLPVAATLLGRRSRWKA